MDKILTILQIKFYKLISINFYYYIREKFRYKKHIKSRLPLLQKDIIQLLCTFLYNILLFIVIKIFRKFDLILNIKNIAN